MNAFRSLAIATLALGAACAGSSTSANGSGGAPGGGGASDNGGQTGSGGGNTGTGGMSIGSGGAAGSPQSRGGNAGSVATGGAGGAQTTVVGSGGGVVVGNGGAGTGGGSGAVGTGGTAGTGGDTSAPWAPSAACVQKASTLTDALSQSQQIGQMIQVDSAGLTTSEASTAFLGSVFSGGGSDPTSGNKASDWVTLISSYLDVAKAFNPHAGLLYGIDAVHGNNNVQDAVMFPHSIGLGATRNLTLVEQVGRITALEMLGVGANWTFAPTVAPSLDERWGRTYETFSETPDLAAQMGAAEIKGLQGGKLGANPSVLACAKHYAGDGATDGGKNSGDCKLDEASFRKLAVDPYKPAIAAGVGTIMVSFSSYQGTKMTGNKKWVADVLKGELGFQGFVTSDWDAVSQLPGSWSEQVKTAINAGLDMVMLSHGKSAHSAADFTSTLSGLVKSGDVPADRVKDAVRRILTIKCEMGLLDGDTKIDATLTQAIGSAEHRAVAREAVRQSMVLLKNDGTLPIAKSGKKIHVCGASADSLANQCGGWTVGWQGLGALTGGITFTTSGTTVLAAIKKAASGATITTSADCKSASGNDVTVVVVGETPYAEGQGDKTNPTLSSVDFSAIAAAKAAGVPFAVVLFSGRPLILTDSSNNSAIDQSNAFVAAWLPGTEGDGIADVLFGDYKPTGKLSFSWPSSLSQIPINDGDGKTALYPFGFGLSY